jgi:hypothetical protein
LPIGSTRSHAQTAPPGVVASTDKMRRRTGSANAANWWDSWLASGAGNRSAPMGAQQGSTCGWVIGGAFRMVIALTSASANILIVINISAESC